MAPILRLTAATTPTIRTAITTTILSLADFGVLELTAQVSTTTTPVPGIVADAIVAETEANMVMAEMEANMEANMTVETVVVGTDERRVEGRTRPVSNNIIMWQKSHKSVENVKECHRENESILEELDAELQRLSGSNAKVEALVARWRRSLKVEL